MYENNPQAIADLETFIEGLPNHKRYRAVEVACGSGELSDELLSRHYKKVELFDQSQKACDEADDNNIMNNNVAKPYKSSMEDYIFKDGEQCNAIYMRQCIGYL